MERERERERERFIALRLCLTSGGLCGERERGFIALRLCLTSGGCVERERERKRIYSSQIVSNEWGAVWRERGFIALRLCLTSGGLCGEREDL